MTPSFLLCTTSPPSSDGISSRFTTVPSLTSSVLVLPSNYVFAPMGKTSNTGPFPSSDSDGLYVQKGMYPRPCAQQSPNYWSAQKAIAIIVSSPTPSYAQSDARNPSQPFSGQLCRIKSAFFKSVRRLAFQRWEGPPVLCWHSARELHTPAAPLDQGFGPTALPENGEYKDYGNLSSFADGDTNTASPLTYGPATGYGISEHHCYH
ncbi:hypothetical protein CSIM01_02097 [Colletotrichum simmondsii]|uniref:Uncharacterized protein n=1 Tax=Colletotrichum simmondsii TaxID=703756 RepID=A0A135RZK3_9PEZI|nr:hypothetical protein CSIM01_02097 [Colletotrichum simmondsii]